MVKGLKPSLLKGYRCDIILRAEMVIFPLFVYCDIKAFISGDFFCVWYKFLFFVCVEITFFCMGEGKFGKLKN